MGLNADLRDRAVNCMLDVSSSRFSCPLEFGIYHPDEDNSGFPPASSDGHQQASNSWKDAMAQIEEG